MKKAIKSSVACLLALGCVTGCSNKESGTYTPGTYTGEGQGFGGTVKVTITTDADKITDVTIEGENETPNIGGAALEQLANAIKEKQSSEIDVVAGATLTSNGVKEAVAKAIELAKGAEVNTAELKYKAGTYEGTAEGYNGPITLEVTFDETKITDIKVKDQKETEYVGTPAYDIMFEDAIQANGSGIDTVAGATFTSRAIKEALNDAAVKAEATNMDTFKANTFKHEAGEPIEGTYDVVVIGAGGAGMGAAAQAAQNGDTVAVIEMNAEIGGNTLVSGGQFQATMEYLVWDSANPEATEAVWDYDGKTYQKVKATQGQLDTLKTILNWNEAPFDEHYFDDKEYVPGEIDLVSQAGVHEEYLSTLQALKKEIQAYVDYADPKLAAGASETDLTLFSTDNLHIFQTYYGGLRQTSDKSEWIYGDYDLVKQFCEEGYDLKIAGVHEEYLSTLQALKKEIQAYVDYADPKLAAGASETDLTLFSTDNLHIFQTYYGGLRQTSDKSEWIYGDYDLVKQFCEEGYDLKIWLEDQGAKFNDGAQITLIGALWYRENINLGCDMNSDGELDARGNWGTYFLPTKTTVLETSSTASSNTIMTRTTAESLIVEDGKVTGVNAVRYDGTPVTLHANKGVILATGGFAANIDEVKEENRYWKDSYITDRTGTTNRSSLMGSGIVMGEKAGAATTGMDFTQMMPISWIDNGDLAFGNGLYGVYINPTTGKRFVDESAERDVLSLGEFENGITVNGVAGTFLEITNANTPITFPYPYDKYEGTTPVELGSEDIEERVYFFSNKEELQAVLDHFGMTAKPEDIYATIEAYDQSILAGEQPSDGVAKHQSTNTVGTVKEDGSYALEGERLRVRVMAPSTHHTMGGLVVDTQRHVLDASGNIIDGLYAAGEVTGGIHGGNRLGGNAIVEIFVSGRNAANALH